MTAANVRFHHLDGPEAEPGQEQTFSFSCPKRLDVRCEGLVIRGRTDLPHDPQGKNGGIAQWQWDGDRLKSTFTPSINCGGCWHGYIRMGRCIDTNGNEEPGAA